jgi:hypothetical protein
MFMKAVEKYRQDQNAVLVREFGKKWEAAMKRAAKRTA